MNNQINNINDLKVGMMVWWFGKYGDLMGGKNGAIITEVNPKEYEYNGEWFDSFSCKIIKRVFVKERKIWEQIPYTYLLNNKKATATKSKCIGYEIVNKWETQTDRYGVSIQGNQIYTSKPNEDEFADTSVEFESECECGGTIKGNGWCDDEGIITSFGYQECGSCGWNQAS